MNVLLQFFQDLAGAAIAILVVVGLCAVLYVLGILTKAFIQGWRRGKAKKRPPVEPNYNLAFAAIMKRNGL